ncbi:hypothetical protein LOK49_LG05G03295 [Camellia lanceoleosa]|uniref:Uncharacterized protein n=1 Tax=Camellia lanceoleosa TaxID=1840588 RepID=A0ACC0HW08_9ERIC|nr:hypothetical protein LOK49_LG05G03295 [Camellia lanceoleosa]
MSWQTYVDDHLMCDIEGNHLTSAAILGHDGSVWAQSASFPKKFIHLSRNGDDDSVAKMKAAEDALQEKEKPQSSSLIKEKIYSRA